MLQPTALTVSGERFTATYAVAAAAADVAAVADWMRGEMTVEFPLELIAADDGIARHVVGRVEAIDPLGPDRHRVRISIAVEVVAGSMTQLLSVVWGNVCLAPGVDLIGLDLPPALTAALPGPAVGLPGLRQLTGAARRPLLMSAIKPLGQPVERLASLAADLAAGGLDIVKDDQSLADQPFAPFLDRVGPIAEAVRRANQRQGTRALYAPSLNGPVAELPRRAASARDAGAGAVMVQPGISGYPALEAAGAAGLPVIAHPGGFGGLSERVVPALVFGTLPRLAGADIVVFVTPGGRFAVTTAAATAIVRACLDPLGSVPAVLPAAGGGITVERVPELRETYGEDLCLLIGGDLHRDGDPRSRAAALRAAVER